MTKDINTIVEGCMPDTPSKLMYTGIELEIPENAKILLWDDKYNPLRFILYGETGDFSDFDEMQNPFFQSKRGFDANKSIQGGLPLREYCENFNWILDNQRSLTTKDGRIYVKATYFEDVWRWYLNAVPAILRQCGEIFSGEKDEDYFYNNPGRAF